MHKGGPLGPMILFLASTVKTCKDFFQLFFVIALLSVTHLLVKKNDISRAIFMLISINGHYCTMSQNLFRPPSLNRFFSFLILFQQFECTHVHQLWAKFYWKIPLGKSFSNFGRETFFTKRKFVFGFHFKTKHFLIVLFADIWLFWVYTHMVQVLYQNSYRKVLKNEWVQVPPSLCTNGSKK